MKNRKAKAQAQVKTIALKRDVEILLLRLLGAVLLAAGLSFIFNNVARADDFLPEDFASWQQR